MGTGDVEKMTVVGTGSGAAPMTHFRVPAREMLLDEPLCCPLYGALTFDGLAIDHEERVHLSWCAQRQRARTWVPSEPT